MYEQITKEQFLQIAEQLHGEVWLKVFTDTISVDVCYPEFEFLSFVSGQWKFGLREYDEENEYQNVLIDIDDVLEIHRDLFTPTVNEECLILTLCDGVQIIIESGNEL